VDNDPIVISHARSLLAKSPGVIAVPGDMRDPGGILGNAGLAELIDMTQHHGEHPRMGATDVCPFVPVEGVTMEECAAIARRDAPRGICRQWIAERLSEARQRAKGLARVLKYLAAINRDGPFYEARELDELTARLGARPPSVAAGRTALADAARAGRLTGEEYLGCLWRRAARDNELLRPASGVLADRHWPPLR